jgi:hypothetical protein
MTNGPRRGWGVSITPWLLFTPGKDLVPIVQEAGWAPGPVWTGAENLASTGIRSLDCPARSQRYTDYATRPTFVHIISFKSLSRKTENICCETIVKFSFNETKCCGILPSCIHLLVDDVLDREEYLRMRYQQTDFAAVSSYLLRKTPPFKDSKHSLQYLWEFTIMFQSKINPGVDRGQ